MTPHKLHLHNFKNDAALLVQGKTRMNPEPIFDLAHLGHMELLTPKPEESQKFFVDVMGMTISGRKGESVYLRGWDDYERYSLKLTASKTSGMEHMALRRAARRRWSAASPR
jgi:catechol-2,3-dioxygenase